MTPFMVRIRAQGELAPADRRELAGFAATVENGELLLRGAVPDQAALLGVLTRLHRAGVRIRDMEQAPESQPDDTDPAHERAAFLARIQLVGHVAEHLAGVPGTDTATEMPATTTIEVQLAQEQALQEVLVVLESLALQVLEVHVRPVRGGAAAL